MSKEDKAKRYVQDKMFPHILNATRMNEEPCFTSEDLRKAYFQGWDDGILETNNSAELKIKQAEEYARDKMNEVADYIIDKSNKMFTDLIKGK